MQPQRHPIVPQHEPEPLATPHYIISTLSSAALASDNSVACAAKRKAPDVVPRDEEQRDCHSRHIATNPKSRGEVRTSRGSLKWIDDNEGTKIMMDATMALKNPSRRLTVSEIHSKRARTDSDEGESSCFLVPLYLVLMICRGPDTETLLSWRRKTRCVPPVAQSGPPRNQKGIDFDSAMDDVTPAQNDIDSPDGCGFSLGIAGDAPSDNVSEKPGPAVLNEAIMPPRECMQLDSGGVPGQSPRRKISKEKQCPPITPARGVHSSEREEVYMGLALGMFPSETPHKLSTGPFGDTPNLDRSFALNLVGTQGSALDPPRRTSDPLIYTIQDDTSDGDAPLALLSSPSSRGPKQHRVPSVVKPQIKGKATAKVDVFCSVDVGASTEDTPLGGSCLSDLEFFGHFMAFTNYHH